MIQELREGKSKPKKAKASDEEKELSKRDQHLLEQVSGYNQSKRAESLMDMHSKERKKQKVRLLTIYKVLMQHLGKT